MIWDSKGVKSAVLMCLITVVLSLVYRLVPVEGNYPTKRTLTTSSTKRNTDNYRNKYSCAPSDADGQLKVGSKHCTALNVTLCRAARYCLLSLSSKEIEKVIKKGSILLRNFRSAGLKVFRKLYNSIVQNSWRL